MPVLRFIIVSISLLIISITSSTAQDLDELLDLHSQNLKELYAVRGTPKEWAKTGKVTERDLVETLQSFSSSVALVIYTHLNDTLITTGMDRTGIRGTKKRRVTRDSLVELVKLYNHSIYNHSTGQGIATRGGRSTSNKTIASSVIESDLMDLILPGVSFMTHFEHVVFVPVLNLGTIPFAAIPFSDTTYLIDHMSYSIAPSVLEFMISKTVNENTAKRFNYRPYRKFHKPLLVSNPTYPDDSIYNFADLPGARLEVNSVMQFLRADTIKVLSGKSATESSVRSYFCTSELLYFATHGISDWEDPMNKSFLVLAPDEDSSGYLTAREIHDSRYDCKLKAHLVVMSACQSGLGMGHDGGVIGLARAFQIAGANHVVMSLWNIDDQATVSLMTEFFKALPPDGNLQPHAALREAMIHYKNEIDPNPKNWTAFSIFGVPYSGY